jgi:hypothetical protein
MWGFDLPASMLAELDERRSASISKEKDNNHNKKKRKVSFLSLLAPLHRESFDNFSFVKGEVIVYFLESNALRSLAVISTPTILYCVSLHEQKSNPLQKQKQQDFALVPFTDINLDFEGKGHHDEKQKISAATICAPPPPLP